MIVGSPTHPIDIDAVSLLAFGLSDDRTPFDTGWHAHRHHQLLYAVRGTLELQSLGLRWLLPPQRAAWIASGVQHRVVTKSDVMLRTVYFSRELVSGDGPPSGVFAVGSLAKEMVLFSMEWGPESQEASLDTARHFFSALALLCRKWLEAPLPCHLPVGRTPELQKAMALTETKLEKNLRLEDVAKQAGLSSRSLRRRFVDEAEMSWRDYRRAVRMLRAMELLTKPGITVMEVSLAVGFESPSAFARAFEAFTTEHPSAYQRRIRAT